MSTSVLGLGIDSPTWKKPVIPNRLALQSPPKITCCLGLPLTNSWISIELSQFVSFVWQMSSPSCRTPSNLPLSTPFLVDDDCRALQSSQEFGRREQFECTNVHSIQFSETFLQHQHIPICEHRNLRQENVRGVLRQSSHVPAQHFQRHRICHSTRQTRILSLRQEVATRILLAISVFAPSRRQRTIQTIHGVVSQSGIFPRLFLDRILEFSLLCFRFSVESLSFQHPAADFLH